MSGCEVSWFAALCDDDYELLGVADPRLQSSWEHCRDIALAAAEAAADAFSTDRRVSISARISVIVIVRSGVPRL